MADTRTPVGIVGEEIFGVPVVVPRPVGLVRVNAVPNPRAQYNVDWWGESFDVLHRVTTAPFTIPGPGDTAFHMEARPNGCGLQSTYLPLPEGVGPGDWLAVQCEAFVDGDVVDEEGALAFEIDFYDVDGIPAGEYAYFVNAAFWADEANPKDALLPLTGFQRFAGVVQVPDVTPAVTQIDVWLSVTAHPNPKIGNGVDLAELYLTNILVEKGSAGGPVGEYGEADAAFAWKTLRNTQLGLTGAWATLLPAEALVVYYDLISSWRVGRDPVLVGLTRDGSWGTRDVVPLTLTGAWQTIQAIRVLLSTTGAWATRAMPSLSLLSGWKSAGTYEEWWEDFEPGLPGEVEHLAPAMLNGIALRVMQPMEPGGEPTIFDEIRHYDGSLRIHDVRVGLYEMRIPVLLQDTSESGLDAKEAQIIAAVHAGGTFAWGAIGVTFAPSDEPSFTRTVLRSVRFTSYAVITLKVMPS
jgi:hypothetical protein